MLLSKEILIESTKQFELIEKETETKIKNIELYKFFKQGKVYKVIDSSSKTEFYILYSHPDFRFSRCISAFPLSKNLKFYKGRRGYIQSFWLKMNMEIEEVQEDNLIRTDCGNHISITDGDSIEYI